MPTQHAPGRLMTGSHVTPTADTVITYPDRGTSLMWWQHTRNTNCRNGSYPDDSRHNRLIWHTPLVELTTNFFIVKLYWIHSKHLPTLIISWILLWEYGVNLIDHISQTWLSGFLCYSIFQESLAYSNYNILISIMSWLLFKNNDFFLSLRQQWLPLATMATLCCCDLFINIVLLYKSQMKYNN